MRTEASGYNKASLEAMDCCRSDLGNLVTCPGRQTLELQRDWVQSLGLSLASSVNQGKWL